MNEYSDSGQVHRLNDFFLARQPILNRDQNLVAYELLFRSAAIGPANVTDDLSATASVIAHASELGLDNVLGKSLGFVNVDAAVLLSDFVSFLPCEQVVLEILETVKVTPEIIARVTELAKAGYKFALDDVIADSADLRKLVPLVSVIKIDIAGMAKAQLTRLSQQFKIKGKKLLAEKVETLEEFKLCLGLGFEYFQGYYFAKPVVIAGKKLAPSQLAVMQLMTQVVSDADSAEIELSIKQNAALGIMLLRLVNTPAVGGATRVDSFGQALLLLGRRQLQRWLQILLYANPGSAAHSLSPLLPLATSRGKLLELISQKLHPENSQLADRAFTVGIMSLMDSLFSLPMEKILEEISVVEEVREALLHRSGFFGDMLTLAEGLERIEEFGATVSETLQKLGLSSEELRSMQLAAFAWSNAVVQQAGPTEAGT